MEVRPYGPLVATGLLVAYLLGRWRCRRYHLAPSDFDAAFFWAALGGIIGARLYHVIDYWTFYAAHLEKIVVIWEGGIGIFGALIGGLLTLFIWATIRRNPVTPLLALASPGLLLGQASGRIGNYFNQEGFGPPTDLPLGVFIDPIHRPAQWIAETHFHPTFFYEALVLAIGSLLLLFLERRDIITGRKVVGFYLIWFGIGRFVVEFLRWDTAMIGEVKAAHVLSASFVLIGAIVIRQRVGKIIL